MNTVSRKYIFDLLKDRKDHLNQEAGAFLLEKYYPQLAMNGVEEVEARLKKIAEELRQLDIAEDEILTEMAPQKIVPKSDGEADPHEVVSDTEYEENGTPQY